MTLNTEFIFVILLYNFNGLHVKPWNRKFVDRIVNSCSDVEALAGAHNAKYPVENTNVNENALINYFSGDKRYLGVKC